MTDINTAVGRTFRETEYQHTPNGPPVRVALPTAPRVYTPGDRRLGPKGTQYAQVEVRDAYSRSLRESKPRRQRSR